jgi:hypothetical protein
MNEITSAFSLSKLARPQQSVSSRGRSDTVSELADLLKLDARAFFDETHITEGMGVLLRQVFDRLMGRSDQGVFRLKQAMDGGKTHNLLATALLAKDAAQRKATLQRIGVAADDRPIRVAAFSGRETDTSEYLWVTLFRALGCDQRWQASSEIPGPSTWSCSTSLYTWARHGPRHTLALRAEPLRCLPKSRPWKLHSWIRGVS